jgi:RNase adaptor protein for sRNA GlmZ degradation
MKLVILTGASGAGKTAIVKSIDASTPEIECLHFDSAGVPTTETMIAEFGSGEAWQKVTTLEWIRKIHVNCKSAKSIIFEGQMRISFISEALKEYKFTDVTIVLVDCDDETRITRLKLGRLQPELANQQMMKWAGFLREEAKSSKIRIIDTTKLGLSESATEIKNLFDDRS